MIRAAVHYVGVAAVWTGYVLALPGVFVMEIGMLFVDYRRG